jgi:hypothetical protein
MEFREGHQAVAWLQSSPSQRDSLQTVVNQLWRLGPHGHYSQPTRESNQAEASASCAAVANAF